MEEVAPEPEASEDTEPVDGALMTYLKFLSGALVLGGVLALIAALLWTDKKTHEG